MGHCHTVSRATLGNCDGFPPPIYTFLREHELNGYTLVSQVPHAVVIPGTHDCRFLLDQGRRFTKLVEGDNNFGQLLHLGEARIHIFRFLAATQIVHRPQDHQAIRVSDRVSRDTLVELWPEKIGPGCRWSPAFFLKDLVVVPETCPGCREQNSMRLWLPCHSVEIAGIR